MAGSKFLLPRVFLFCVADDFISKSVRRNKVTALDYTGIEKSHSHERPSVSTLDNIGVTELEY
jgi:hypothetical protein